jgi:hypothetical protein
MLTYLILFFDICRFRSKPQDLSASPALRTLAVSAYVFLGIVVSSIHQTFTNTITTVIADTILLIALAHVSLWIVGLSNRANQTLAALAGTGSLFSLMSIPFLLLINDVPTGEYSIGALLLLSMLFWNIAVIGHIMKNALDMPSWAGLSIAIIYFIISYRIMRLLVVSAAA